MKRIKSFFVALMLTISIIIAVLSNEASAATDDGYCYSCYHRSQKVIYQFKKSTGYPKGRKGYVIDHVCPLACGGKDAIENMQWQTITNAKSKDKWERSPAGCSTFCKPELLR